jgi:hypothetical protein
MRWLKPGGSLKLELRNSVCQAPESVCRARLGAGGTPSLNLCTDDHDDGASRAGRDAPSGRGTVDSLVTRMHIPPAGSASRRTENVATRRGTHTPTSVKSHGMGLTGSSPVKIPRADSDGPTDPLHPLRHPSRRRPRHGRLWAALACPAMHPGRRPQGPTGSAGPGGRELRPVVGAAVTVLWP